MCSCCVFILLLNTLSACKLIPDILSEKWSFQKLNKSGKFLGKKKIKNKDQIEAGSDRH